MRMTLMLSAACATLLMAGSAMAADKGDAAKGKEVFEQCGVCHNIDSPDKKPNLKNGKPVTDANVKAIVNAGGNGMPAYADMLSDDERADLIAYLKTI